MFVKAEWTGALARAMDLGSDGANAHRPVRITTYVRTNYVVGPYQSMLILVIVRSTPYIVRRSIIVRNSQIGAPGVPCEY